MQTAPYPESSTLYTHAFSAVCVSAGGDSVYVSSGSRTDHGEVEDRNGRYANLREMALNSLILKLPLNRATPIMLPNDSTALAASGYVFCRGVRNAFDLALDAHGRLFGVENSGERDDPEELNWYRAGQHYGFPWTMGGHLTPMQFPYYNPAHDPLLSTAMPPDRRNRFYRDPTFPARPVALRLVPPIPNAGPHAIWHNDGTGRWVRRSGLATFTPHRSPLGLTFAKRQLTEFAGGAFVLAYSAGGNAPQTYMPALDPGEDLSFICLTPQPTDAGFTATVTQLVHGFKGPTDAELVGKTLYVIEHRRRAIWRLRLR